MTFGLVQNSELETPTAEFQYLIKMGESPSLSPIWNPYPMTASRVLSTGFQDQPPHGAPPARTWLCSGQYGLAEKLQFLGDLRVPGGTLGPLLGDPLVTMGLHINPWGAM